MRISRSLRRDGRGSAVLLAGLIVAVGVLSTLGALSAKAARSQWAGSPASEASATPVTVIVAAPTASAEQVQAAHGAWSQAGHADTWDNGQGANTTCASCKSPRNWDPTSLAAEASHDCLSCKREPGQPRPELPGGVSVPKEQWRSITCDDCHQPAGDSYSTAIAFWNQALGEYEPVASATELCGKCHEGRHGFDVVWEQETSPAHKGWECTRCHGSHGTPVECTDCHDISQGRGVEAHRQHPETIVNCTACHDATGLPIWQDPDIDSRHYGTFAPQRFAHALRSWPAHNIQTAVDCRRCHHPQGEVQGKLMPLGSEPVAPAVQAAVVPSVGCNDAACHPGGAVFEWCPVFPRDTLAVEEVQKP